MESIVPLDDLDLFSTKELSIVDRCENCVDWGSTIIGYAIPCPKCGRKTHPWEGVNIPEGSSWSLSVFEKARQMGCFQTISEKHQMGRF